LSSKQNDFHTFEAAATEQGYRLIRVLSSAKAALNRKTRQRRLAKAEQELTDLRPRLNRYKLKTRSQIEAAVAKICRPLGDWLQVRVIARQTTRSKKISERSLPAATDPTVCMKKKRSPRSTFNGDKINRPSIKTPWLTAISP